MIYGYLRVSTDVQDINNQKQGVVKFAETHNWNIDEYITDEGVSGGKDPDKRNLGPLLKKVNKDDIIIASEISRLGRDLYMVMDILKFCMDRQCKIYTVKDNFVLGDDIQSKVLAFAFGLSAEIERQMIRQRTKEGLKLRVKLGVLVGRPPKADEGYHTTIDGLKDKIIEQFKWGVPQRRIAQNFSISRNTVYRALLEWGCYDDQPDIKERLQKKLNGEIKQKLASKETYSLLRDGGEFNVIEVDDEKMTSLIEDNLTIPEIAKEFTNNTYDEIYDTILCSRKYNPLYRVHGQKRVKSNRKHW